MATKDELKVKFSTGKKPTGADFALLIEGAEGPKGDPGESGKDGIDGSGAVSSVNGEVGAVTGLAKQEDIDSLTTALADKAYKKTSVHVGSLVTVPALNNVEMIKTDPGPRFTDYFDEKMWGYKGTGEMHWSSDEGTTWNLHTKTWNPVWGFVSRILPTGDGEVLVLTSSGLRKSIGWKTGTVTWSEPKVSSIGLSVFNGFGLDGYGSKFILVDYANTPAAWVDSRYGYISTDYGETFTQVWDSVAMHGQVNSDITHLHGVTYDRWADRFYLAEGHGPAGGLYYTLDDGLNWGQAPGHRDGVLKSQGITNTPTDTNGPTVLISTNNGLVMGSDNSKNGLFGMVRKDNPEDEVVTRIYSAEYSRPGLIMFAQRGWRDSETGVVYMTFRSEFNDVPPIICAGTPTKGGLVYEYPTMPVVGGSDRFAAIARTSESRLVAYAQFGTTPYTLRGDLSWDSSDLMKVADVTQEPVDLGTIPQNVDTLMTDVDLLMTEKKSELESTIPRYAVRESASGGVSGNISLTYFTAIKTEIITRLHFYTGTNAAPTPTLIRFGIYEVKENKDLVLVASSVNDTTLLKTQNSNFTTTVSPFTKVRGKRYAVGFLVVTAFTMPTLFGVVNSPISATMWGGEPRLSGNVPGLDDLPNTILSSAIGISARIHYVAMV